MSMLFRRSLVRAVPRSRGFATTTQEAVKSDWEAKQAALRSHAAETSDLWRRISIYVCIPAIAVCTIWTLRVEQEHHEHIEHIKHEHGGELPEVPEYEYMNKRAKPFPWGDNSLFFNPEVQKNLEQ